MNTDFWRGKRVFVTGHTGFKGGWLCFWLKAQGAEVTGFALPPPSRPNLFDAFRLHEQICSYEGDIREYERLRQALDEARPEILFHLAAQSLVRPSYQDPISTYSTNVMGTAHVLEAARHSRELRVLVNVTSDKCYENREWYWGYRENDPLGGHDPYSNSKACAELVTDCYRKAFFQASARTAVASVRAGNVIGGGDWARDRLIPDIMRAAASGHPVVIRNPYAIRPWQHVLEPLAGYLRLAEHLWEGGQAWAESWNFGPAPEDARTVQWIVNKIASLWQEKIDWQIADIPQAEHEAKFLKLDCSKARMKLNWVPRWDLEQALLHTLRWYQAFYAGKDLRALTLEQIQAYHATPGEQP